MHDAALKLLYVYLVNGAFDKEHQEKQKLQKGVLMLLEEPWRKREPPCKFYGQR